MMAIYWMICRIVPNGLKLIRHFQSFIIYFKRRKKKRFKKEENMKKWKKKIQNGDNC